LRRFTAYFDRLQQVYETANNPQIRELALGLLSEFRDPTPERRALAYAVSGEVRNQDAITQFRTPLGQRQTRNLAWDFIRQNWSQVQGQFTSWTGASLVGATSDFCSEQKNQEVVGFLTAHPAPASTNSLERAEDLINDCAQRRGRIWRSGRRAGRGRANLVRY